MFFLFFFIPLQSTSFLAMTKLPCHTERSEVSPQETHTSSFTFVQGDIVNMGKKSTFLWQ